jgi:hypothetical protein
VIPSTLSCHALDAIARGALRLFDELVVLGQVPARQGSELLDLTEADWAAWTVFRQCGPRPAEPALPDMLLRLAVGSYALAEAIDAEAGLFEPS